MSKIFAYITGVLCWLNATVCNAAEKFEILPDLPDPLLQPAQASTVSKGVADVSGLIGNQSVGHEPSLISVVFSLLFVILLIYVTGILYARLNRAGFNTLKRQQGELAKSQVNVVSTTALGNNKTLHVVELDGKRMLIGASSSTIQLIKDLGTYSENESEEEYSHIEIPNIKIPKIEIPRIEIPSIGLSKIITKAHGHKNFEKENSDTNVDKSFESVLDEKIVTDNVEENCEGIIDSLFAPQQEIYTEPVEEENLVNEHIVDPDNYALHKKYLS